MEKILYILFAVCLFTACSDDDDDKNDGKIKPTTESIIGSWADTSRTEYNFFQFIDSENGYLGDYINGNWHFKEEFTYTLNGYKFKYIYKNTVGGGNTDMYFKDGLLYIGNGKYGKVQLNNSEQ